MYMPFVLCDPLLLHWCLRLTLLPRRTLNIQMYICQLPITGYLMSCYYFSISWAFHSHILFCFASLCPLSHSIVSTLDSAGYVNLYLLIKIRDLRWWLRPDGQYLLFMPYNVQGYYHVSVVKTNFLASSCKDFYMILPPIIGHFT